MKQFAIVLSCSLCLLASPLHAQPKSTPNPEFKQQPVTIAELDQRTLQGHLGLPLGTATEIDAEIISGRSLRRKQYQSAYLLKVTHVAGKKLDDSITVKFYVPPFASVKIANNTFALYELKTGEKTGRLTSNQINELEKGYVGKTVRLVVYESGSFSGIPDNLPDDVPVWQDTGFHFSTMLNVLAQRKK